MVARRVFGDGRTRAYAWGRAVAREDVAAAAERLIAMSGQFEQRRLARPSFQLDVLDAFCGAEQLERRREAARAWRELVAARRRLDELTRDADAVTSRLAELQALVDATEGMEPGDERELLARRERLRHVEELAEAARAAAAAIAPDEGEGAASLAALAERALAPLERIAPELGASAEELRDLAVRLARGRERPPPIRRVARRGARSARERRGAAPGDRRPQAALRARPRTTSCSSWRPSAERELGATADGGDPVEAARRPSRSRGARRGARRRAPRDAREAQPRRLGEAVADELASLGMGEGEFLVELRERELGADRRRRGDVPHPSERGPPVRAGRGHGLRRRAVADRARARGGRGR